MKQGMKASSVRKVLSVMIVLLVILIGAGFYYAIGIIQTYAVDTNHAIADASASSQNVEKLRQLKQALADSEQLIAKADQVFATNQNYQSQAVTDVQRYATDTGVTISNTSFKDDVAVAGTNAGHTMVLTLQSPVSYAKLIRFLDALESNLPKFQVTGINLNRPAQASGDLVEADSITLGVSTR